MNVFVALERFPAPWDTLIGTRQDSSNIANGLCHVSCLEPFNIQFPGGQHAQQANSSYLVCTQDVTFAGIYKDVCIAKSVTNAITNKIERHRALSLASNWY